MGSQTIHVIGLSKATSNGDGTESQRMHYAMNRTEMAQKRHKAIIDGHPIIEWYSQTSQGTRILGYSWVADTQINHVKLVTCPICEGDGVNGKYHCPVCNGSGVCRKGNEKRWQDWQLLDMRRHRVDDLRTGVSLGGISEDSVREVLA